MAGGGGSLRSLASAAQDLKSGRGTRHPELYLFRSWGEVQDYAENDPAGADLLPWVELVDELGTEAVLAAVDRLGSETSADVTVSTVHKAKGREWPAVRIGEDFTPPEEDDLGRPGRRAPCMMKICLGSSGETEGGQGQGPLHDRDPSGKRGWPGVEADVLVRAGGRRSAGTNSVIM